MQHGLSPPLGGFHPEMALWAKYLISGWTLGKNDLTFPN
jgi:hypothetical protein